MYIGKRHIISKQIVIDKLLEVSKFVEAADLRGRDVIDMLSLDWKDYEDSTQYACAKDEGCECIVTRNVQDFALSDIPVKSVADIISIL